MVGMTRIFDLDWQLVFDWIPTLLAIGAMFFVFSYFFFNPIRKFLQKREDLVKGDVDQAAADKEAAGKLKAEYEAKLANANQEVEQILSDGKRTALKNKAQIIDDAKEESARIIAHAKDEAELEKSKAADDVKQKMIEVATVMAAKAVSASINTEIQDTLVDETLKEIGDATWLS